MIRSFPHKGLERFYRTGSVRGIRPSHADRLRRVLAALEAASSPAELDLPGFRLHQLRGKRASCWSITVSGNWRIVFRFSGTDVELIDYLDYH